LASRSLADFLGVGVFLKLAIHFSTSSFVEACSSESVFSYDRRGRRLLNGDEVVFFCENWALLDCHEVVFFCGDKGLFNCDVVFSRCVVVFLGGGGAECGAGGGGDGAECGGGGGGGSGDTGRCNIGHCCGGGDDTCCCSSGGKSKLEDSESSSPNSISHLRHRT
jgi:hypothetical protein